MRAVLLMSVFALLTSGCTSDGQEPEQFSTPPPPEITAPDRAPTAVVTAPETELDAAPVLSLGEWWTVRLESELLPDGPVEWTRVVAGVEGRDYLVGQPRDSWSTAGILFHVPGLGEVDRADLSYEAHDVRFHPLVFPLGDGAEWDTAFEGLDVHAEATENRDGTVTIRYCCGRNITATWDPSLNAFALFEVENLLRYTTLDHGTDFQGIVTVPHGHDLVFRHGRISGVLDPSTEPAAPVEDVELSDDYDRITFAQIAGDRSLAVPLTTAYIERVTGPDGTLYETMRTPEQGPGLTVALFETTELGGTWQFQHAAPGPGIAFTEGIAYHVFDVELPGGELLGDHSEHVT